MQTRLLTILCAVVLTSHLNLSWSSDQAGQESPSPSADESGPPKQPYYLTGKEEVWHTFPSKPALGSPRDQADLLITLTLQNSRTDEQKNEALHDRHYSIKLVTDVIATDFETKYPNTFKVLKNADIDAYFVTAMLKQENGRLRPYVQHPVLVVSLFTVRNFSYPSGHASGMELQARILQKLFPSLSDALLNRARQIADGRIVAGVHYASDTEAGLALGDLLFTQLETKSQFENDLTTAAIKDNLPQR